MITDLITPELLKIRIHHIGGIGGYGPTTVLKNIKDTQWVVYDADSESLDRADDLMKKNFLTVNYCIGKTNGKVDFNVMRAKSSSSMLPSSPEAAKYTVLNPDGKTAQIWGEHTRVDSTFPIDIHTIDWLVEQKKIPPVDFISIDAQGAEYDIFQGAAKTLNSSVIGVECEVDFSELYEKQGLFGDIHKELLKNNFRLSQIYNHQYFNTVPLPKNLQGKGFLTVGEALFLKNLNNESGEKLQPEAAAKQTAQSLKLAAVAVMFDQLDFALTVLQRIDENKQTRLKDIAAKSGVKYVSFLSDLYSASREVLVREGVPVYGSTNTYDREKGQKDFAASLINYSRPITDKYLPWYGYKFRRYGRKSLLKYFKKHYPNYLSEISSVYASYGFYDLAEMHEKRLAEFRYGKLPLYRNYQRNKFKGRHAA